MSDKEKKTASMSFVEKMLKSYADINGFPPLTRGILESKIGHSSCNEELFLEEDEINTISLELLPFIKELLIKVEQESKNFEVNSMVQLESIIRFVDLMFSCLSEEIDVLPEPVMQIIVYFNKHLRSNFLDFKNKDAICALCEKCCQRRFQLSGSFITETLKFLFERTLEVNRKPSAKELKRVNNLHEVIFRLNVDGNIFEQMSVKFLQTVESPVYLFYKEGQQFISFLLNFDQKFLKKVHNAIKYFLPDATKVQAKAFGKIYQNAWLNSSEEQRQMIEKQCIQDYMSNVFVLQRSHGFMEMSQLGKNVFAILSYFHYNRRLIHLSKIITELYTPLIWRHLRSGGNIIRCNAAEVFLDVYPLEKPGVGRADQAIFLQRQHDEMADLLTDNCHIVRIIAVKGICRCLKNLWDTFSAESIKVLMETMVNEMINDGSSSLVRKAVYEGFAKMLQRENSAAYLAKVLPSLKLHIHDENEKVRRAFVDMLIELKKLPDSFPLKYWKVVPADHLAARLALENEEVGKPLVRLIMNEFYSPEKSIGSVLKRIYKMILMNHEAAKKLFTYSKDVLSLDGAVSIMLNILAVMNERFKEVEKSNSRENADQGSGSKKRKRLKVRNALSEINGCEEQNSSLDSSASSSTSSESNGSIESSASAQQENVPKEPHQLDNLDVCHAFIDIAIILWSINSTALNDPANAELLNKIQAIAANCVPLFLRHFKGTKVYFAVIHFASLVPMSKLTPVSTISSMCVSQLKSLTEYSKKEEIEVYVNALCSWNRAPEILELAIDWLDQAFRAERLNQSAALRSSARRKVKFQQCEAKPLLALKLIDIMFMYELNRVKVLKKYNAVYEMFVYLERVKVLIERRVTMDTPFPDVQLSDEFLLCCLYRYTKLMLILHKCNNEDDSETASEISSLSNINAVSSPHAFPELIDWAVRVLVPKIPESLDKENKNRPITVNLIRIIVRSGSLLIACNLTSKFTTLNFINFITIILGSGSKLAFVDDAFRALKELVENSEAHYQQDEERLLRVTLPTLLTNIIDVIMEREIKKDVLASYITDFVEMKRCILSLPLALIRSFGIKSQTLHSIIVSFSKTSIRTIADNIEKKMELDETDRFQNLPGSSFMIVGALLSRENVCKLWFFTLPEVITSISNDSVQLLASVSLLHTLSFVKKPKLKELLTKAVQKTHEVISALPVTDANKSATEAINNSVNQTLNARKLGIPVLTETAKRLGFDFV